MSLSKPYLLCFFNIANLKKIKKIYILLVCLIKYILLYDRENITLNNNDTLSKLCKNIFFYILKHIIMKFVDLKYVL